MSRKQKTSIPLHVDADGHDVLAALRPPDNRRKAYYVRWKRHGRWHEKSTGTDILPEAKRVGRAIVRGEYDTPPNRQNGLTIERFLKIQELHFGQAKHKHKGERSLQKFLSTWSSFRQHAPDIRFVQDVDAKRAVSYIKYLQHSRKDVNYAFTLRFASETTFSPNTIRTHFRTLRAAWNRVRLGDPRAKSGLDRTEMVSENPWDQISNDLPAATEREVIQFDLEKGQFESLLDSLHGRPVAQLFLIISFWANGRLEAMSELRWDWIDKDGYITIPDAVAKNGKGKVVRIPLSLLKRLHEVRQHSSPYVFAGFPAELRDFYLSDPRKVRHANRIKSFTPKRLRSRIHEHMGKWATAEGEPGLTHHAIRRTGMELCDEAELLALTTASAEKLRTTVGNKRKHYLKKHSTKRQRLLADALYNNFCVALSQYPKLAARLSVEILEEPDQDDDLVARFKELSAEEQAKLLTVFLSTVKRTDHFAG